MRLTAEADPTAAAQGSGSPRRRLEPRPLLGRNHATSTGDRAPKAHTERMAADEAFSSTRHTCPSLATATVDRIPDISFPRQHEVPSIEPRRAFATTCAPSPAGSPLSLPRKFVPPQRPPTPATSFSPNSHVVRLARAYVSPCPPQNRPAGVFAVKILDLAFGGYEPHLLATPAPREDPPMPQVSLQPSRAGRRYGESVARWARRGHPCPLHARRELPDRSGTHVPSAAGRSS